MRPELLHLLALQPDILDRLRLVRAALDEPDRRDDEEHELEELRLPVLEERLPVVRRGDVAAPRDRLAAVLELLLVVRGAPCDRLAERRREEEREEEQREAVVAERALHRCRRPTAI